MCALAAVHFTADNSLCVLHGDPALGIVDVNDQDDDSESAEEHEQCDPPLQGTGGDITNARNNAGRESGNDAREEDHRDTVADTVFGDLLTQPHDQSGTGGEGQDDDDRRPDVVLCVADKEVVVLDEHVVTEALKKADTDSRITGDGGDLLSAFLALVLAQSLQCGDSDAQQLDDDGSIDVGLD